MRTPKARFSVRKDRVRTKIKKVSPNRLRFSVFKSGRHIYAQIIDDVNSRTVVSASSLHSDIRKSGKSNCNIATANKVGQLISKKAKDAGITEVTFDRGGYKYHGRVKVLADAARENLSF
jgi:large subunit ribosomal protein L18